MRPAILILSIAWLLAAPTVPALRVASAQAPSPSRIKLATQVPDGSVWHVALKQMASDWRTGTQGRIELVVYAGGTQGDEMTVVRKMQLGQLQASALTAMGLCHIDSVFNVFGIPLFYDSPQELFFVMERLTPVLRSRLDQHGFVLLGWGHAGWVHVFSRSPLRTIDEVKRARLFTSAGPDDRMAQWYKSQGFNPVQLTVADVMVQIETNHLDAVPATPLSVLAFEWFKPLPYMLDIPLAPLVGANLVTKKAWDRISPADREVLLAGAARFERRIQTDVVRLDREAVTEMEKRALKPIKVRGTPEAVAFERAARVYADSMRGDWVSTDVFDQAVRFRNEYRRQQGSR